MDEHQYNERLASVEQRAKSNSHRLDRIEEDNIAIHQIATSVEVLAKEMEFMRKSQEDFSDRLTAIEKKPVARMDQIVTAVIVAIVGICVGYLFGGVI